MTIGERLRLIRNKSEMTLKKTAAIFDITAQTLSRYENGDRTPDNDFLKSFGKHFNLYGDWLLYEEPPIFKKAELKKCKEEVFLELSALIHSEKNHKSPCSEMTNISLDKHTRDTPNNYILMLEYMLKDAEVRKNMFQFFYLFQKPTADKRKYPAEKCR
jgi:transcriptional regulator with XRE-family HTH domain